MEPVSIGMWEHHSLKTEHGGLISDRYLATHVLLKRHGNLHWHAM
jgi:hypothetical protein